MLSNRNDEDESESTPDQNTQKLYDVLQDENITWWDKFRQLLVIMAESTDGLLNIKQNKKRYRAYTTAIRLLKSRGSWITSLDNRSAFFFAMGKTTNKFLTLNFAEAKLYVIGIMRSVWKLFEGIFDKKYVSLEEFINYFQPVNNSVSSPIAAKVVDDFPLTLQPSLAATDLKDFNPSPQSNSPATDLYQMMTEMSSNEFQLPLQSEVDNLRQLGNATDSADVQIPELSPVTNSDRDKAVASFDDRMDQVFTQEPEPLNLDAERVAAEFPDNNATPNQQKPDDSRNLTPNQTNIPTESEITKNNAANAPSPAQTPMSGMAGGFFLNLAELAIQNSQMVDQLLFKLTFDYNQAHSFAAVHQVLKTLVETEQSTSLLLTQRIQIFILRGYCHEKLANMLGANPKPHLQVAEMCLNGAITLANPLANTLGFAHFYQQIVVPAIVRLQLIQDEIQQPNRIVSAHTPMTVYKN